MKRLGWNSGGKLQIDIIDKVIIGYENEKEKTNPKYEEQVIGCISFMDRKDMVRFSLHVAKELGISKLEYKIFSEEVIKEMGDWN